MYIKERATEENKTDTRGDQELTHRMAKDLEPGNTIMLNTHSPEIGI